MLWKIVQKMIQTISEDLALDQEKKLRFKTKKSKKLLFKNPQKEDLEIEPNKCTSDEIILDEYQEIKGDKIQIKGESIQENKGNDDVIIKDDIIINEDLADSKLKFKKNLDFKKIRLLRELRPPINKYEIAYETGFNTLNDFQKEIIADCLKRPGGGGLSLPMGSGKTLVSIVLALKQNMDQQQPSLIICAKSLIASWITEFNKFFGDYINVEVLHSEVKGLKIDQWRLNDKTMFVLTTPEVLTKYYRSNNVDNILIDKKMPHPPTWINYYKEPNNNLGLDIVYRINPSSKLMLTINPDFGQVESDPANINLTAFETYFKEKRPFFLNNMDIFETPVEIFYSRRIGDSSSGIGMNVDRNVERTDTLYNVITIPTKINVAGKLTGKNENGLSYGLLSALVTESDSSKWKNYYDPDTIYYPYKYPKQYFISRVKQDLLLGNSFLGFMSTSSFADSQHTFSVDGMANLFENQLNIDGQIIMTSDKYKGIYGSISYYPSGLYSGWVDYYYYDKGLNINELGYLWRDDYTQTKVGIKFQTMEPWNIIRNASVILEGDMEENTSGLDLGKSIELNYDIQFDNFWGVGGGLYKVMDYYDDRKIIHDYDRDVFGPHILIPEITGYHFNITTDKHQSIGASISFTSANNSRDDLEKAQFIELTYKPNSYSNFSILYDHYNLNKKYHWLESFWEDKDGQYHHIFSSLHRTIDVLTFRSIVNINRKLSLQGYLEIYSNYDKYSNYTEYLPATNEYGDSSNYVNGWDPDWADQPLYTTSTDSVDLDISFVDPNFDLQFHPKYTDFRSIIVIKWNYRKGSNLYFVYSNNKAVDGHQFNKINQLGDFLTFNQYEPWVEVLRDQTFMMKIDYWFEK